MIAHVVRFITKPGAAAQLQTWVQKTVLPDLLKDPDFLDLFFLVAEGEPRVCVAVSLWQDGCKSYAWEKSAMALMALASLVDTKPWANEFQVKIPACSGASNFKADLKLL